MKEEVTTELPNAQVETADTTGSAQLATPARHSISLLIVGDGYSDPAPQEFNDLVTTIQTSLNRLPGAAPDGSSFNVKSMPLPRLATGLSQLGVTHTNKQKDCYFKVTKPALDAVFNSTSAFQASQNFAAERYLVIVNKNGADGCSYGEVMFMNRDTYPDTIIHEMGHSLAGLFDERGLLPEVPPPSLRARNCSFDKNDTAWGANEALWDEKCDGYQYLLRPTNSCKMQTPSAAFCKVCERHLTCAIADGQLGGCVEGVIPPAVPQTLRNGATEGLDVVAVITNNKINVIYAENIALDSLRPQVITGDTFAVVYDGSRKVGVSALSMDDVVSDSWLGGPALKLTARGYSDDGTESVIDVKARLIRMTIIGVTRDKVKGRELGLDLRRLTDARKTFVLDDNTILQLGSAPAAPKYGLQGALMQKLNLQ